MTHYIIVQLGKKRVITNFNCGLQCKAIFVLPDKLGVPKPSEPIVLANQRELHNLKLFFVFYSIKGYCFLPGLEAQSVPRISWWRLGAARARFGGWRLQTRRWRKWPHRSRVSRTGSGCCPLVQGVGYRRYWKRSAPKDGERARGSEHPWDRFQMLSEDQLSVLYFIWWNL